MEPTTVNFKELFEILPALLKFGITGFGTVIALLAFILIKSDGLSASARKYLTTAFMVFGLALFALGVYSFVVGIPTAPSGSGREDSTAHILNSGVPIANGNLPEKQQINFYTEDELWSYIDSHKDEINELYIAGAHLQNGVGKILEPLTQLLQRGAKVSIVFINPADSMVVASQAERDVNPNSESIKLKIRRTNDQLSKLRLDIPTAKLEWRVIDWPIDERIHIINPKSDGSRIYVKLYPFKHQFFQGVDIGGVFFYTVKDSQSAQLYNYYLEKFVRYFEAAKPVSQN